MLTLSLRRNESFVITDRLKEIDDVTVQFIKATDYDSVYVLISGEYRTPNIVKMVNSMAALKNSVCFYFKGSQSLSQRKVQIGALERFFIYRLDKHGNSKMKERSHENS